MPDSSFSPVYAHYEPEPTLKTLIGASTPLSAIFTAEKIDACQKIIEDAKDGFFSNALPDILTMQTRCKDAQLADNQVELCKHLFDLANNIKAQADTFGFPFITRLCRYLMDYCEQATAALPMTAKDVSIIIKLTEALSRAFREKINDEGSPAEQALLLLIEQSKPLA